MNENMKPRFKLGAKGNTLIIFVGIVVLLLYLFGGKGINTAGMNGYATTYDTNNPGSVKIFDIGTSSKVAMIRHEDGTLTALSFRKIPLLDRWKVTKESTPFDTDEDMNVWMSVDDGINKYHILSDGETLSTVEKIGWYGIYARLLYDIGFALGIAAFVMTAKKVWKRRADNKIKDSIPS